jgi:hypothetical protein
MSQECRKIFDTHHPNMTDVQSMPLVFWVQWCPALVELWFE